MSRGRAKRSASIRDSDIRSSSRPRIRVASPTMIATKRCRVSASTAASSCRVSRKPSRVASGVLQLVRWHWRRNRRASARPRAAGSGRRGGRGGCRPGSGATISSQGRPSSPSPISSILHRLAARRRRRDARPRPDGGWRGGRRSLRYGRRATPRRLVGDGDAPVAHEQQRLLDRVDQGADVRRSPRPAGAATAGDRPERRRRARHAASCQTMAGSPVIPLRPDAGHAPPPARLRRRFTLIKGRACIGISMSGTDDRTDKRLTAGPSCRAGGPCCVLGAAAASTVVTVRPALAQTAGSVLNCEIPVPGPHAAGNYIGQDGTPVAPGTPGAAPPLARPLRGEEAKAAAAHGTDPAGRRSDLRSGLCQLYQAPAVGDERLHLLRLAADAALSQGRRPMAGPIRYIADPDDAVRTVALDGLSACSITRRRARPISSRRPRRRSSARCATGPADAPELLRRLQRALRLRGRRGRGAIHARLGELEEAGLVRRA